MLSLNLTGTVSTLPNAKGDLFVQMGVLRSQVNIKDLEMIDEATITGPDGAGGSGAILTGAGRRSGSASSGAGSGSGSGSGAAGGRSGGSGFSGSAAGGRDSHNTGAGSIKMSKSFSVSPEINLIGKTTDEAIPLLDKYLDDAYLAHLPQVRIVHGRGTGALRNAVHKRLKRLNYVQEFRLGEFGEGDTGVTIVIFK